MSLVGLTPKKATFKATLVGGKKVTLTLRPFTLADVAWFQEEFPDEKDLVELAEIRIDPSCRAIWQMLDGKSRNILSKIRFTDLNPETNKQEPVEVHGYKILLHSFDDENSIQEAFLALGKSRGLNGFIEDQLKKKIAA